MKKLGILLSGRGSNLEAIAQHVDRGQLNAEIAVVVSNIKDAPGLQRARQCGIESLYLPSQGLDRESYDLQISAALTNRDVSLVCLAGFMRLLSPTFIRTFPQRILNIHPSLLPAFPGLNAQKQALLYGVRYTGCTVHFVDEGLDSGPIILQSVVPVLPDDVEHTLANRILAEEHKIYPKAIQLVLENRVRIEDRRVIILPNEEN